MPSPTLPSCSSPRRRAWLVARRSLVPLALTLASSLLAVSPAPAAPARAAEDAPAPGVPRVEVAFALDATGSMGPWIVEAQDRIEAIARDLAEGEPAPDVRFALVAYRDKGDAFVTRLDDFSRDLETTVQALRRTQAQGGGDHPEAVIEALNAAVYDLDWTLGRAGEDVVKLLYLVGDAPPNRHPTTPPEDAVLAAALERGIVVHSIACGGLREDGERFFERVARLTEGRAFRLRDDRRSRGAAGASTASGAAEASSLGAVVSASAKAYSEAAGVAFADAPRVPVARQRLECPPLGDARSGLRGAHLRVVQDAATFADLWAAHVSLMPREARPPCPAVDFTTTHVAVLGGGGFAEGLTLASLEAVATGPSGTDPPAGASPRVATLAPAADGVRFVAVPAGASLVAVDPLAAPEDVR